MDEETETLEELIVAKVSAKMEVRLQEMQEKMIALFQDFTRILDRKEMKEERLKEEELEFKDPALTNAEVIKEEVVLDEERWTTVVKKNRLSGSFKEDSKELKRQSADFKNQIPSSLKDNEAVTVIDNLSFIQQLNYKFNYAKQKSDNSITYVQSTTLTDVHQDLKPYVFKMSSLIHVSTRLVKIVMFLLDKNARLGKIMATDFVDSSLWRRIEKVYRTIPSVNTDLEPKALKALFNNTDNYLNVNAGFGCLVYCIILTIPTGLDINNIMVKGFSQINFWSKQLHGQRYRIEESVELLDVYTRLYNMIFLFSTMLYNPGNARLSMSAVLKQFLEGIYGDAPVGKSRNGDTTDLHIVALARIASSKYSSIDELSEVLATALDRDSSSASSAIMSGLDQKYHFHHGKVGKNTAAAIPELVFAMLDEDPDNGALDDNDSSSDESWEVSSEDAGSDTDSAGIFALPRSYTPAEKLDYYKTQPCFRFFRFKLHNELEGCNSPSCKFSHDTANADMVKKYHDKRPTFLRAAEDRNKGKARGKFVSKPRAAYKRA